MKRKVIVTMLVSILVFTFLTVGILAQEEKPPSPFSWRDIPEKEGQIVVRIGDHCMSDWCTITATITRFMEEASILSDNAFNFEWFTHGVLGNETDQVQMLQIGSLEIHQPSVQNAFSIATELGPFILPYIFMSMDEALYVTKALNDEINEKIKGHGLRILAWEVMGFRHFYYRSDEPIEYPEDLKKYKFRVPDNKMSVDVYKGWGASPVPMAWPETFSAFQQGVIDGGDNPVDDIIAAGLYEPANRVTKIHYSPLIHPLFISEKFFQGLSEENQNALIEAGKRASEYTAWWVKQQENSRWKQIEEYGLTITDIKDEDRWAELSKKLWPEYYDEIGGKEWVDRFEEVLNEYRESNK